MNQVVALPLPLNDKRMPIPFSFMARNVEEILKHSKSNVPSSNAYVQITQPLPRIASGLVMGFDWIKHRLKILSVLALKLEIEFWTSKKSQFREVRAQQCF